MRESIDLTLFNVGLISNPDQQDIPNEAQAEGSYNLDVEALGKLKGIPKQTSVSIYGLDGVVHGWIERNTGEWDLVYSTGSRTKIITDFYGTQAESILAGMSAIGADSIIPNNQEVHVGTGKTTDAAWIGYIEYGQFGDSAPGFTVTTTKLRPVQRTNYGDAYNVSITASASAVDGVLDAATSATGNPHSQLMSYEYALSYTYDGYQESPIRSAGGSIYTGGNEYDKINLKVTIPTKTHISDRITSIQIWRRDKLVGTQTIPGEYRLIESVSIADWVSGTYRVLSGTDALIYIEDINAPGLTYEEYTGISEVIEDTYVKFGVGTVVNNMLFVTDVSHSKIPEEDSSHVIFRSKSYRYDMFDWVNDKLTMPTKPKAMKSHRGKLYVWDENNTYVINPTLLQIENVISGRGCSSQQSVIETDYGLFWANQNGVYWSTVTEELLQPTKDNLSEPIRTQYQTAALYQTPKLVYNSPRNQLLVHLGDSIYAYNTVEKRWDYYYNYKLVSQEDVCGCFTGKDGETYTVTDENLYKDFSDTDRKSWVFYSKEFILDDPSQDKKFYKIVIDSTGTLVNKYSLDGGSTWTTFTSGDINIERAKTIKIYITGDTDSIVDSISIIYRRLRGKR